LEIGGRTGGRGTVVMTFVSSVHNPKIMLGMLIKVLCGDSIATRRRLPCEGNVTFEDLMRAASDFDVRAVAVEGLTSVRYLLPITVGIIAVIATMRSAGLYCSHDACCINEEVESFSNESVSEHTSVAAPDGAALFLYSGKLFRACTLDGVVLSSNGFFGYYLVHFPPKLVRLRCFLVDEL
jgi:hypothetical protein